MDDPADLKKLTVRLPTEVIAAVKRAAIDEGRTAQDILLEAARGYLLGAAGPRTAASGLVRGRIPAYTSVEVCAGAGGQAIGLEQAGFRHLACVEIDPQACSTLRLNRPGWEVIEADLRGWKPEARLRGVDLLSGGVPCPPFSIAGRQLGADDERDLFPEMVRLTAALEPRAVLIENVRGLLASKFEPYRRQILADFEELGYGFCGWELLNSADFGVPQSRLRAALVLIKGPAAGHFAWPTVSGHRVTLASALEPFLRHWIGYADWAVDADAHGPALVGGSKKHGGPDLGPTRARAAWRTLGVDGLGVADHPPLPDHQGPIRLTVAMAAAIQGFPSDWRFVGRKTSAYRQVGNAFPPPVARAVGGQILAALSAADSGAVRVAGSGSPEANDPRATEVERAS